MGAIVESLIQVIWNIDSWAAEMRPSGPLTLILALSQFAGALLMTRWLKQLETSKQMLFVFLMLSISLISLLITPMTLGWLLLLVPTGLALAAGYSPKPSLRWGCRLLWITGGASALLLGGVGIAAILSAGLAGWLFGYLARQVSPFEAVELAAGQQKQQSKQRLELN